MSWASVALFSLVSGSAPVTSPAPLATPPVIVTVTASPLCSALRSVAIPVGYVMRRNDEAFQAAGSDLEILRENNPMAGKMSAAAAGDLPETVTTSNTASMTHVRLIANAISQNLMLARAAIDRSWHDSPAGKDPKVDALRQRLINLLDLQDALVNQLTSAANSYFDNGDGRGDGNPVFAATLQYRVFGAAAALRKALEKPAADAPAAAVAHDVARSGSTGAIVRELGAQERAFSREAVADGTSCGI